MVYYSLSFTTSIFGPRFKRARRGIDWDVATVLYEFKIREEMYNDNNKVSVNVQ